MSRSRAGFVLLPLLLLVLGGLVLVLGVAEGTRQLRVSTSVWTTSLQAEEAAAGGLRLVPLAHPGLGGLALGDTLTVLSRTLANGARSRVVARRLSEEVFFLEGTGAAPSATASRALGRVVWRLDAVARVAATPAVVQATGAIRVRPPGSLDASRWTRSPTGWPGGLCLPYLSALAALGTGPVLPSLGLGPHPPALGPRDVPALRGLTTPLSQPVYRPTPTVRGGVCVGTASNWGAPSAPTGPCGGRYVTGGTAASLVLRGGEGQGLLVVEGDLTLADGVWFSGVVVVGGHLRVASGARLEGFALAGGGVVVSGGGRISGSACAAARALEGATASWGASHLPDGGWIEPF